MSKKRGLILGKLAPFHIGHMRLIEIATKEVDEVYLIIYDCPDLINIPLNVRSGWVRHFFPKIHIIEGWDALNKHEDTVEVRRLQEEYVKRVLNGKKITHFFSSDYYGEHMSKFLGAIDRRTNRYDPKEGYGIYAAMIRATMIRNGKHLNKKFLSPFVYKDILIKVAFIGVPSKEQSKLVKQIAKKLKTKYVEDNILGLFYTKKADSKKLSKRPYNFYKIANDKYKIANNQDKIFSGKEYFIYNSTGFIDHLLSIATHNEFNEKSYSFFCDDMRKYDLVFVNHNPKDSIGKFLGIDDSIFFNQITKNLDTLGVCYKILTGTIEEKISTSEKLIKAFPKRFN